LPEREVSSHFLLSPLPHHPGVKAGLQDNAFSPMACSSSGLPYHPGVKAGLQAAYPKGTHMETPIAASPWSESRIASAFQQAFARGPISCRITLE